MTETFKCSWCKHSHDISELEAVGENKRMAETYLEAKRKYEAKRSELPFQNEVIPADLYCPRTSDGRDTLNPGESKYDCLCVDKPKYKGGRHLDQRNYHYEEKDKDLEE
ncbi:36824_t:CDS:2 [Gigaspora margarita]|uniref:36824_t:CDS:1 n=1 Tax=Gigaspora margarita TaxID=4874 RepID=A0ABM8W710_GIGMA|nr:36824_t:CDS:2 [Gigaspora margarita]